MMDYAVVGQAPLTLMFQKLNLQFRCGGFDDRAVVQLTASPSVRAAIIAHV